MNKPVSFFHDHYFTENNDVIYSTGCLTSELWSVYDSLTASHMIVCARFKNKKYLSSTNLADTTYDRVSFEFFDSISNLKSLFVKNTNHKKIESIVLNSKLVIARLPSELGLYASKIAIDNGIPLITEVVACAKDSLFYQGGLKPKLYSYILSHRVKVIVRKSPNSMYVTNKYLQNKYPCKGNVVGVSDVSISSFNAPSKNFRLSRLNKRIQNNTVKFGIIGNLSNDIKGVDIAINALSKLDLKCKLEVVGGGDFSRFEELAKTLSVDVVFKGFLPKEKVFAWLDDVDIYLQPSRTEGLSRSVLEAMGRYCPVISSSVGGLPEVVHGKFIHQKNNVNQLTEIIQKVFSHESSSDLIEHSITISELFSDSKLFSTKKDFYQKVMK